MAQITATTPSTVTGNILSISYTTDVTLSKVELTKDGKTFINAISFSQTGATFDVSDWANGTYTSYYLRGTYIETNSSIIVSTSSLTVNEGSTATFTIKLAEAPSSNQTINIACSNANATVNKTSLTFTPSNWNTAQTVTVTGTHQSTNYSNTSSVITVSSPNVSSKTINVTITNVDTEVSSTYNITLKPTTATGSSWSNVGNTYDGSTTTVGTVSIRSSNYSSRTLTLNFNTSSIPSNATINSATLNISAKSSASSRITMRVDINGSSSNRVINQSLTTSQATYTADISNTIKSLTNILVTGYMTSTTSTTFSIYEVWIDVEYETGSSSGDNTSGDTGGTNILPAFSTWSVTDTSATISSMTDYSLTMTCTEWNGIALWGTTILEAGSSYTFNCTSMSSNVDFSIYDASGNTVTECCQAWGGTLPHTFTVSGTSSYDIYINSTDGQQITIANATLTKN